MTRSLVLGICFLACFGGPVAGQPATAGLTEAYLRQPTFIIPFQEDPAVHDPVEVQLYMSTDQGATWQLASRQRPSARRFNFRATKDGRYWFSSRTISGRATDQRTQDLRPELLIHVDTRQPQLDFQVSADGAGTVHARWMAYDGLLSRDSFRIEYRTGVNEPWRSVSLPPAAEEVNSMWEGETRFVPDGNGRLLDVRAEIKDRAGNLTAVNRRLVVPRVARQGTPSGYPAAPTRPYASQSLAPATGPVPGPASDPSAMVLPPVDRPSGANAADPPLAGRSIPWPETGAGTPWPRHNGPEPPRAAWEQVAGDGSAAPPQATTPPRPDASTTNPRPGAGLADNPAENRAVDNRAVEDRLVDSLPAPVEQLPVPTDPRSGAVESSPGDMQDAPGTSPPTAQPATDRQELQRPAVPVEELPLPANPGAGSLPRTEPKVAPVANTDSIRGKGVLPEPPGLTPVGPSTGQLPNGMPAGERPAYTPRRRFELDYDVDAAGSGVAEAQLWVTINGGRRWELWGKDADRQSPFEVEVHSDGLYGFRMVIVGVNGLAGPPPEPGDPADIWVAVDPDPPVVRLTGAQYGRLHQAGKLVVRWDARDPNLEPRPITLEFAADLNGPWTIMAADLPNSGEYAWTPDASLPRHIYVRINARDLAGNQGQQVLQEPIAIDGLAPRGRIRGFRIR